LDISGIILAGGKSSRMGTNKAFLQINGVIMIERVARVLTGVCSKVIISGDEKTYSNLGYRVVPDIYPGCGPLSGIYAGLLATANHYIFISACDTPYQTQQLSRKSLKTRRAAMPCYPISKTILNRSFRYTAKDLRKQQKLPS